MAQLTEGSLKDTEDTFSHAVISRYTYRKDENKEKEARNDPLMRQQRERGIQREKER